MLGILTEALTRLKSFCTYRREHEMGDNGFEKMDLPMIGGTPEYTPVELIELDELTKMFNRSRQVAAKWSPEVGRLAFTSEDGSKFWFAASGETCEHLAALVLFEDATFRARLQHDGRVSLTGWCENWFYGTIAHGFTLAKW